MHEIALARSMIELIDSHAAKHGADRVLYVHAKLGVLSAMTRALYVSFKAASLGTRCEGATIEIEEVPLTVFCRKCYEVKRPIGPYNFRCSSCGQPTPEVVTGREMQLVSIELDETISTKTSIEGQVS